jgi:hypothetical protein
MLWQKMRLPILILSCILVFLSGCEKYHHRPGGVPSSATWVDGTFIVCSIETEAKANRCTVYKDDSGEILADGLFVLYSTGRAADSVALDYAAFGKRKIYLANTKVLVPFVASERDPSNRLVHDTLVKFAGPSAGGAIDCGKSPMTPIADEIAACGIQAFAQSKAFYLRYDLSLSERFQSYGLASDGKGDVAQVIYNSEGLLKIAFPKKSQFFGDGHVAVTPCPKPVVLVKTQIGELACALPPVKEDSSVTAQQEPVETTVCEIAENPSAFNNKLVRVRGHVWVNFEYSAMEGDGCSNGLWFAYGDGSGPPGLAAYVMGGAQPGAEDEHGEYVPPIRVKLVRDSNFTKFQRMMATAVSADSRATKSSPDEFVYHRVTATFVGRIDGVSPEIHAFHLKRSEMDKADYLGFGQMGLYDAQLVVKSVESGATLDIVRVPSSSSKTK